MMAYSKQRTAITGRKQYSPPRISRPAHYPAERRAIPQGIAQEVVPVQATYTPKPRRSMHPAGDMDISAGLPEGFSSLAGFPALNAVNEAGLAAQQGNIKGAITSGFKGMLGLSPYGMPASVAHAILGPPIAKGYQAVKGALGFGAPANLGSAVPSGTGISGLSGPMGLAAVEGSMDLADLDIGGFDGDIGIGDDGMSDLGEGFE